MAATAIFLSGITAVLTAQHSAQKTNAMAVHWSTAGMLANNYLEHMRLLPSSSYGPLTSSGLTVNYGLDGATGNGAGQFYRLTGKANLVNAKEAELTVTVTWTEPATKQAQTLEFATKAPL